MSPAEVIELFRLEVVDVETPYLWTDVEVYDYLDDAQTMLCRLTQGIRDSSSAAAQIALTAHQKMATVHAAVKRIHGARLASTGVPLDVYNHDDIYLKQATLKSSPFSIQELTLEGDVKALITDVEDGKVQVVRIPAANDTVLLTIDRLPLTRPLPALNGNAAVPFEVRAEHHRHLVKWMKHRAYSKHDADTYDEKKATSYRDEFFAYCHQVYDENERRRDKPRLIEYGGL